MNFFNIYKPHLQVTDELNQTLESHASARIFQLVLDVFQPMGELYHVLLFVLHKYLKLNVKGLIPDVCQLLQMKLGRKGTKVKQ